MELTRSTVERKAEEYRAEEPLYPVEQDGVETLPAALSSGEFGRRDAEWVVRWYYRRFLGAIPNAERRAGEERFRRTDFETVVETITAAGAETDAAEALERLTTLEGVDVAIGSAFLFYLDPERYVVVGEREWTVLEEYGELEGPYPDPPSVEEYETYLESCRSVADRFECDLWTLYRALWRLWKELQ